jgi:hypothetical protein
VCVCVCRYKLTPRYRVVGAINVTSAVGCTFFTDVGCQTDKAWHFTLPVKGPKAVIFPDSFLGVNRNRTMVSSYECGVDTSA